MTVKPALGKLALTHCAIQSTLLHRNPDDVPVENINYPCYHAAKTVQHLHHGRPIKRFEIISISQCLRSRLINTKYPQTLLQTVFVLEVIKPARLGFLAVKKMVHWSGNTGITIRRRNFFSELNCFPLPHGDANSSQKSKQYYFKLSM